jgi:nucleotide-binding universal stress UspA family protein
MNEENTFNKNILIAVDESENARRAVLYVARLLEGAEGFRICILHVINEPEEDFFPDPEERDKWIVQYTNRVDKMLEEYRQIFINRNFDPDAVSVRSTKRYCPSMSKCILEEKDKTRYNTIVVGRQGLSRTEEFLFGSISSKIVNYARNCTVWVVE